MRNITFILCTAIILLLNSCNGAKRMSKISDSAAMQGQNLTEKYWKLIELYGNPVTTAGNSKEAHIIFHAADNRFSGGTGCNNFSGSYQIQDNVRIKLSQTIATQMMCLDMSVETQFLQALEMADNYSVSGDTMMLNRARMAPLARFAVVHLR